MSQPRRPATPPTGRPVARRAPVSQPAPAARRSPAQRAAAPRTAPRRPSAPPAARGSRLPDGFWLWALAGLGMILVALLMQMLWPNGFRVDAAGRLSREKSEQVSVIHGTGPLRLNELMSSNASTTVDEKGESGDWLEVANIGHEPMNLYGYGLARDAKSANVFYFPDMVLESGECVLVFADSQTREEPGQTLHAPFRLSAQGGSVMLFNRKGNAIDSINFPAMSEDQSYVRVDTSEWQVSDEPTPGLPNTEESYQLLHTPRTDAGVEITELVASNSAYAADANGAYHDYFELHNTTGADMDLGGWYVSDDKARPAKWRLPEGFVVPAGGYRIVYASGLDRADPNEPHAAFGLSTEGEDVVLSDPQGRLVDAVSYDLMKQDEAWLKGADGSWGKGTPSPGAAN